MAFISIWVENLSHFILFFFLKNVIVIIPPQIGQLTNLVQLLLRKNKISKIPGEIGKLENLKTLSLSENEIEVIPVELGNLSSLQNLYLHQNKLTTLPEVLKWPNMNILRLDSNNLTSLPDSIGVMTNATEIHLEENQLTKLPATFNRLSGLRKLFLNNNKLTALPDIYNLEKLATLAVHKNQLYDPDNIRTLNKNLQLFRLTLEENQLPEECTKFIIDYGAMAFIQLGNLELDSNFTGLKEYFFYQMIRR